MNINTKYHGVREYTDKDIISFQQGLPGFEHLKNFIIFPVEENDIFNVLHSIENENIGIVTVSPFYIDKNYQLDLGDEYLRKLNIKKEQDVLVLATVTLSSKIEDITVNLKAPIIINIEEGLGEQLILDDNKYSIKQPLIQE